MDSKMEDLEASQPSTAEYRIIRPNKPALALGLAVNHLMNKPAFEKLQFGEWSKILIGQINRGHYCFVIDADKQIQGFAGWALTSREKAEAWVEGRRGLSYEDCLAGDCMVCNVWSASSTQVHRWMFREAAKIWAGKQMIYFKRFYPDGRIRPARMNISRSVTGASKQPA